MQVFISYRRDDSAPYARLIRHELCARYGEDAVFTDLDDINHGDDFAQVIDTNLAAGDVVVVVIGPRWAEIFAEREGGPDYVRHEVRVALARRADGAHVLPVIVGGTAWPPASLPADIGEIARLDVFRFDPREKGAGDRLAEAVERDTAVAKAQRLRRQRRATAWAVTVALVAFAAAWTGLFDLLGLDTHAQRSVVAAAHALGPPAPGPAPQVVVVLVDPGELVRAAPPWRGELARFVGRVADSGARVLVVDVLFEEARDPAADAALAAALAAAHERLPVVLAVERFDRGRPVLHDAFAAHAGWGIACLAQRAQTVVAVPLAARRGRGEQARLWPSLGLAAYVARPPAEGLGTLDLLDLGIAVAPPQRPPTVVHGFSSRVVHEASTGCSGLEGGDLVVDQWLDARATEPARIADTLRWETVLAGDDAALRALKNRHVLLGAADPHDQHRVAPGDLRAGVYLVAAQLAGLLHGPVVQALPGWAHAVALVALATGGARLAPWLRERPRRRAWWPALAALALVWLLACVALYRTEAVLVSPLYGLVALAAGAWIGRRMSWR